MIKKGENAFLKMRKYAEILRYSHTKQKEGTTTVVTKKRKKKGKEKKEGNKNN